MKVNHLGTDVSPGRRLYEQDVSRIKARPLHRACNDRPPSALLHSIRSRLPRTKQDETLTPSYRSVISPLQTQPSLIADPLAPCKPTVVEEIAWWGKKVVWSKGSSVFRTYTYEHEQEDVNLALFAWFPDADSERDDIGSSSAGGSSTSTTREKGMHPSAPSMGEVGGQPGPNAFGPFATSFGATWHGKRNVQVSGHQTRDHPAKRLQRCLVVFLETIAFFYFATGETKVASLPRLVEEAWSLENGGIVMRTRGLPTRGHGTSRQRKDKSGNEKGNLMDELMDDPTYGQATSGGCAGEVFSLSRPGDRFRPILVDPRLELVRDLGSSAAIARSNNEPNLLDLPRSNHLIFVSTESLGLIVCYNEEHNQLVFYRYGRQASSSVLDEWQDDSVNGMAEMAADPMDRDARVNGTHGRSSVGGRNRKSLAGGDNGREPVGALAQTRRISTMSAATDRGDKFLPKTLAQAVAAEEMELTMVMGTTASQWKVAPALLCQEIYRYELISRRIRFDAIGAFVSGKAGTEMVHLNVHVRGPSPSLLRFAIEVPPLASAPNSLLQRYHVRHPHVVPCEVAQPIIVRPGAGVEVILFDKPLKDYCAIMDEMHQVQISPLPDLTSLLHAARYQGRLLDGNNRPESPASMALSHFEVKTAGSIITVKFTAGSTHSFDFSLPVVNRLGQQLYIAVRTVLTPEAGKDILAILENSEARTLPQAGSAVQAVVDYVIGTGRVENSAQDVIHEFYSNLAEMAEPDLRRLSRRQPETLHRTSAASDGSRRSLAIDVLNLMHWIGQDCLVETSRQGDLFVLVPELCRLAKYVGYHAWNDYWWRLFPAWAVASTVAADPLASPVGVAADPAPGPPDLLSMVLQTLRSGDAKAMPDIAKYRVAYPLSAMVIEVTSVLAHDHALRDPLRRSKDMVDFLAAHPGAQRDIRRLPWALRLPVIEALRVVRSKATPHTDRKILIAVRRYDLLAQYHTKQRRLHLDRREISQREILLETKRPVLAIARRGRVDEIMGSEDGTDGLDDYRRPEPTASLPKFRFVIDRRLDDIQRLLQTHRPRTIKADNRHELTSEQRLDHEEKVVVHHAQRVLSRLIGQGILSYGSWDIARNAIFTIPALELAIRIMPSMDLRLPAYAKLQADVTGWPSFNNGVAGGLSVKPSSSNIDYSWIAAHRRTVPMAEFGGFLLGLGLNGHLTVILKDNIMDWLAPRYDQTSVGLLLGMAASFAGSQSEDITRHLATNLPCLLPGGGLELNTSPIVQSAAFMGIGIVHAASGKNRLATVALNEIGRQLLPGIEPLAEYREAYSFSAACAFGLIMLGQGGANPTMDAHCVPRLRAFCDSSQAVGGGGGFADDIDHDVTAPGATLALGLMFLRTGRSDISGLLALPDDVFGLDQVRPDLLLVRTLSRALVHWQDVEPSMAWIEAQIPPFILLAWKDRLKVQLKDSVELAYIYIMTGACLAMAIRYAGTLNDTAYRLLHSQVKAFADPHGSTLTYEGRIRRGALKLAQSLIAIALGLVVAGSGDLTAYRRIRFLLGTETGNFAWRTALNMSAGLLFMGTGRYTFGSSNMAVASMCIAFFPRFAAQADHNFAYLQAYRHFWAMAVEPRCIVTGDIDSLSTVYMPLKVEGKEGSPGKQKTIISPALLSTYDSISAVAVGSPRYHQASVPLGEKPSSNALIKSQIMFVKRKAAYVDYIADPKGHRTLNMLAGPLFNNSVDGIVGDFGGSSPNSPDIRDLPSLVAEHTADPLMNALVQRLNLPVNSTGGGPAEQRAASQPTSSWIWPMVILRTLLQDRLETMSLEVAMVMSTDGSSADSGMINMRHLKFARDYYSPEVYSTRYSMDKARAQDPLFRQGTLCSMLEPWSRPSIEEGLQTGYFETMGSSTSSISATDAKALARQLMLSNVPGLDSLECLRSYLIQANSRMLQHSTQTKGNRLQALRWLARARVGEMFAGSVGMEEGDANRVLKGVPIGTWNDASLMAALRAWFP